MKFLMDECLTVELVEEANRAGFEAYHIAHLWMAGRQDWNVVFHAVGNDLICVTNNARDFRGLYEQRKVHPGLVILIPNIQTKIQILLFRAALQRLAAVGDPTNKVVDVDRAGDMAVVQVFDLPVA